MDKRKLMLLLGAMVVAVGSALTVRAVMAGHVAPAVRAAIMAPSGPRVLVAQHNLPIGTIITPDAVAFQAWPRDMVQDAYFLDRTTDKAKLIGTVVRNPITAGQPLTQGALVVPGDRGFLAAALGPGMRAITIPVSDMSGVAGFIFPGDHVDMMLTQSVKSAVAQTASALPLSITETVLRNLRVLATDQTTETEVAPGGKSVVKIAHDVTLEVPPRIAEKIEVAQTLGTLSLALRSLADSQGELDVAVANTRDQSRLMGPPAPRAVPGKAPAMMDGATSYATGGDVSRFARRNLNGRAAVSTIAAPTVPTIRVTRGSAETAVPIGAGLAGRIRALGSPLQATMGGGD